MDKIKIQDLEVFAKHGVFKEETVLGQKFLVSAVLHTDTRRAGNSDDIHNSTNYGEVCHFITAFMQEKTYKLIETVAEQLAKGLMLKFPLVRGVTLEIKKPWAPIGLSVDYVSVEIERSWHQVYLSIGSNMGEKEKQLDFAVRELKQLETVRNVKVSDYIQTEPYGGVEQDVFLNGAVALETMLSPEELLEKLHEIEAKAGRERLIHWGPRTLDLDIVFYDDLVMDTEDLVIPHIDMQNRDFVLRPLAQLCPGKVHPVLRQTVKQMLENLLNDNK